MHMYRCIVCFYFSQINTVHISNMSVDPMPLLKQFSSISYLSSNCFLELISLCTKAFCGEGLSSYETWVVSLVTLLLFRNLSVLELFMQFSFWGTPMPLFFCFMLLFSQSEFYSMLAQWIVNWKVYFAFRNYLHFVLIFDEYFH